MNTTSTANDRLPFLDGLRVAAFALLVPFHVGMYYVTWGWHVKSASVSPLIEPIMMLSTPWRLGLLFFIAGVASQVMASKRGTVASIRDRSIRLLLPLIFGMAVITPPQMYYEIAQKMPLQMPGGGGYLAFWKEYLEGFEVCGDSKCLTSPDWNHLWFLPYLWAYSMIAIMLAAFGTLARKRTIELPAAMWIVLPAVPLVLGRLFLFPKFPSTHDFFHDPYNHLVYGWLFIAGWLARSGLLLGFWDAARRFRWPTLVMAVFFWAFMVHFNYNYTTETASPALLIAIRTLRGWLTWMGIMAACGWAQVFFTKEWPALKLCSQAVFFFYILHQTVIVVLSQWLKPLALWPAIEGLVLVCGTFLVCWASFVVARRLPGWFGVLVGIQPTSRSQAPFTGRSCASSPGRC